MKADFSAGEELVSVCEVIGDGWKVADEGAGGGQVKGVLGAGVAPPVLTNGCDIGLQDGAR